jgi:hypothetical protein
LKERGKKDTENCGLDTACTQEFRKWLRELSDNEDNPAIHYSVITSLNDVMKDASTCISLAAKKDVLCLEYESAKLTDTFQVWRSEDFVITPTHAGTINGRDFQELWLRYMQEIIFISCILA